MNTPIRMRNYGRIIQDLIAYTVDLPQGERRDTLTRTLATAMANRNLMWNRDQETSVQRVIRDMQVLSDGALSLSETELTEAIAAVASTPRNNSRPNNRRFNRSRG